MARLQLHGLTEISKAVKSIVLAMELIVGKLILVLWGRGFAR